MASLGRFYCFLPSLRGDLSPKQSIKPAELQTESLKDSSNLAEFSDSKIIFLDCHEVVPTSRNDNFTSYRLCEGAKRPKQSIYLRQYLENAESQGDSAESTKILSILTQTQLSPKKCKYSLAPTLQECHKGFCVL